MKQIKKLLAFLLTCLATSFLLEKSLAQSWQRYTADNSQLPTNQIFSIAIGPDETIWAATAKGLAYFHGGRWLTWNTTNSSLPSDFITAVAVGQKGEIWAAFPNKGIGALQNNQWKIFEQKALQDTIYRLQFDKNNGLWAWGANPSEVHYFDGNQWITYSANNSCLGQNFRVETIIFDDEHKAHIKTLDVFLEELEECRQEESLPPIAPLLFNTSWVRQKLQTSWPQFTSLPIRAFTTDEEGQVWIATDLGLATYKNKEWITYSLSTQKTRVRALASDKQGDLWVATDNAGIFYFATPNIEAEKEVVYLSAAPNPFHEGTTIRYNIIASPGRVILYIQDQNGARIATLVDEVRTPGNYELYWNPGDLKLNNQVFKCIMLGPDGVKHLKLYYY
jgi:ligand-binding sensor domain-containing protein